MNERPNITVVYEQKTTTPGVGAVLIELISFFLMAGLIALVIGSCSMFK